MSVFDPLSEENESPDQPNVGGSSDAQGSSVQASSTSPSPSSQGSVSKRSGTASGRFNNLQNYVRGNQQAARDMTGQVTQNVGQQVDKTSQQIKQQGSQAQTQLADTTKSYEQKADAAKDALTGLTRINNPQAAQSPQGDLPDLSDQDSQFDLGAAETQISDVFNQGFGRGVKDLNFDRQKSDLSGSVSKVKEVGQQLQSDSGRDAVAQRIFNKPSYSKGQSRLDSFLMGQDQQNLNQLNEARKLSRSLDPQLQNVSDEFSSSREQALANLYGRQEGLGAELEQGMGSLESNLADRISAYQTQKEEFYNDPGNMTDAMKNQVAQSLGGQFDPTTGKFMLPNIGEVDASLLLGGKYAKGMSNIQADMGNIDPEQAARLNVLRRLSGKEQIGVADQQVGDFREQFDIDASGAQKEVQRLNQQFAAQGVNPNLQPTVSDAPRGLASHFVTHNKAARGDLMRNPLKSSTLSMLTPEQRNAYTQRVQKLQKALLTADSNKKQYHEQKLYNYLNQTWDTIDANARQQASYDDNAAKKEAILRTAFGRGQERDLVGPDVPPVFGVRE